MPRTSEGEVLGLVLEDTVDATEQPEKEPSSDLAVLESLSAVTIANIATIIALFRRSTRRIVNGIAIDEVSRVLEKESVELQEQLNRATALVERADTWRAENEWGETKKRPRGNE